MKILAIILSALLDIVPAGDATLTRLQQRDSILIADQLRYGVTLEGLDKDCGLAFPDFSVISSDTLTVIGGWQLDTLVRGKVVHSRNSKAAARLLGKPFDIAASIVISPFEPGTYNLPDIPVLKARADSADTLIFKGVTMEVKTMPVDTSTFVIHDIKGQMGYPVTIGEVLPWVGLGLAVCAFAYLIYFLIARARRRREEALKPKDPAYIVALRELEKYRSDKYWAPERQKSFYSGITDALKFYMDERFGVDAPEMTTAELFDALKDDKDITPAMYSELKELFERADFVKFAKYTASDEDNAKALPLAVSFVTSTYAPTQEQAYGEEAGED